MAGLACQRTTRYRAMNRVSGFVILAKPCKRKEVWLTLKNFPNS